MGRPRKISISEDKIFADVQESEVGAEAPISEEEYQRRIKLDVSNPDYINPSYDR